MGRAGPRFPARTALFGAFLIGSMAAAVAGEASAPNVEGVTPPTVTLDSGRTVVLFPPGDFYPPYIADPHRAGFGLLRRSYSELGIADSGDSRYGLKLGGRFGLARVQPPDSPDRGWQLGVEAGFNGLFDVDNSYDNIGWDGIYGLIFTQAIGDGLAVKLGALHNTSSHVGDEYAERTGRRRLGYTRQEFIAGVSWSVTSRWRTYAETGRAYEMGEPALQRRDRAQLGLEYEHRRALWDGRLGWYAAADVSATEERAWRRDVALQLGLSAYSGGRRWRLGLEHYRGRPFIGEFFQNTERYTALGLWLDLY